MPECVVWEGTIVFVVSWACGVAEASGRDQPARLRSRNDRDRGVEPAARGGAAGLEGAAAAPAAYQSTSRRPDTHGQRNIEHYSTSPGHIADALCPAKLSC
ncbi:unnamed protein product [Plutella xylostella]|uniref:(diamondback moth) hypothetical protein n=1 Tax=Plutella xylostella TaxID=51655 RepID=A0A8S4FE20_PLUXY|nr:unnamed protein product [Plutella xylostella]